MGVHVLVKNRIRVGGRRGECGVRDRDVSSSPPHSALLRERSPAAPAFVAVIVAGLDEPLWQQSGFGDICHFSESVSGGEGPGGGGVCVCVGGCVPAPGGERREVDS